MSILSSRLPHGAVSVCLVSATFLAHAQSSPEVVLSPTVVTATRVEQPLGDVLPSLTLITRHDIQRSQARSLADLLAGEAGFEFGRNGGPGTVTSFFLRGANSTNLVVMVDGVRAQVDGWGSLAGVDVPLQSIDRIEILRGNAAALYGEAAIGGVIQIFTRRFGAQPGGYAEVSVGSYHTREASAGYTGRSGRLSYRIDAGTSRSRGFSAMNPLTTNVNPDDDGSTSRQVLGKLEYALGEGRSVGMQWRSEAIDTEYDRSGSRTNTHELRRQLDSLNLYGTARLTPQWTTRLDMHRGRIETRDFRNGLPNLGAFDSSVLAGDSTSLRWFNTWSLGDHVWNFGLDANDEDFSANATSSGYVATRRMTGYFAGWNHTVGDWTFQANLRCDDMRVARRGTGVTGEWSENSWLLGTGYRLTDAWRLTASASTGFRAPSAGELASNANLQPETHRSAEAGISHDSPNGSVRLVAFRTRTTDAIFYPPWPQPPVNIGRVENEGVELSGRYRWGRQSLRASLVSQDPWNVSDNSRLARRARLYGSLEVARTLHEGAEAGIRWQASGDRLDSTFTGAVLPGYSVVSLFASYRMTPVWTLRLKMDNVFDREYELVRGYQTAGRSVFATLTYQPRP